MGGERLNIEPGDLAEVLEAIKKYGPSMLAALEKCGTTERPSWSSVFRAFAQAYTKAAAEPKQETRRDRPPMPCFDSDGLVADWTPEEGTRWMGPESKPETWRDRPPLL